MEKEVYTTKKGTKIYYEIIYDLGGDDYFNQGEKRPRGYYLIMQRNPNEFIINEDISKEKGASKLFLKRVKRKSKKSEEEAKKLVNEKLLQELADMYGI